MLGVPAMYMHMYTVWPAPGSHIYLAHAYGVPHGFYGVTVLEVTKLELLTMQTPLDLKSRHATSLWTMHRGLHAQTAWQGFSGHGR